MIDDKRENVVETQSPESIDLDSLQVDVLDSMMVDIKDALERANRFSQMNAQAQQGLQQAQIDLAGNAKAAEKFINILVKTHGAVGMYLYDKEHQKLVLKK